MAPTNNNTQQEESDDINTAKAQVLGETSRLNSFLLKPDGLSGIERFNHMVWNCLFDPKVMENHPKSYLYIKFSKDKI